MAVAGEGPEDYESIVLIVDDETVRLDILGWTTHDFRWNTFPFARLVQKILLHCCFDRTHSDNYSIHIFNYAPYG